MTTTLLIDGHNLAFRAYHLIKSKSDKPIEECKDDVIFIFLNSFLSYYKMGKFDNVVFAWDHKTDEHFETETNYRKGLTEYKENRDHSKDDIIFSFIEEIITITEAMGCRNILPKSLEADDIIFYYCKNKPGKKFVVSSDKDLLQIVDENTAVYSPNKKMVYNHDNFQQLLGMTPEQFVIYKAILGDASDNIAGLERFGPKKSAKLAIDSDYRKHLNDEQIQIVENNLNIMDLTRASQFVDASEFEYFEEQLAKRNSFDDEQLKSIFKAKGYKKFLFNFHEWTKLQTSSVDLWEVFA